MKNVFMIITICLASAGCSTTGSDRSPSSVDPQAAATATCDAECMHQQMRTNRSMTGHTSSPISDRMF